MIRSTAKVSEQVNIHVWCSCEQGRIQNLGLEGVKSSAEYTRTSRGAADADIVWGWNMDRYGKRVSMINPVVVRKQPDVLHHSVGFVQRPR